jgi:hypothetical protein
LKAIFPKTIPVSRPLVKFTGIPDPNWLSGFTEADDCFFISIYDFFFARNWEHYIKIIIYSIPCLSQFFVFLR